MPNRKPADRFSPYRAELLINELATGFMFATVAATKHDTNPESAEWALAHAEISYQSALLFLASMNDSVLPEEVEKLQAHIQTLRERIEEAKCIVKESVGMETRRAIRNAFRLRQSFRTLELERVMKGMRRKIEGWHHFIMRGEFITTQRLTLLGLQKQLVRVNEGPCETADCC